MHRRLPPVPLAALQPHRRVAAEDHRARVYLDGDSDHLAQPAQPATAKLKIKEMGSRYLFIVVYMFWLEKYFSRGDYRRREEP